MTNKSIPTEITVNLPPHLGEALAGIAITEGKSFADILLQAAEAYLQPKEPVKGIMSWSGKVFDEAKLAKLYASFAEEDQELAEKGIADYIVGLDKEDL